MSKLAHRIAASPTVPASPVQRGPRNACFPIYGAGDLEDWDQVEAQRGHPHNKSWREVQDFIDGLVGVERRLPLEKFRYHWRRRCYCWPEDLRR